MSDSKKKEGATTSSSSKGPSKTTRLFTKLHVLKAATVDLQDEVDRIAEHEAIVAERDSLRAALLERDGEITRLKDENTGLRGELKATKATHAAIFKGFETQYEEYRQKTNRQEFLEAELKTAKEGLDTTKKALDNAHAQLDTAKRESSNAEAELVNCKAELELVLGKLTRIREERSQLRGERTALEQQLGLQRLSDLPLTGLEQKFEDFADNCHQLAWEFFKDSIVSDRVLENIVRQVPQSQNLRPSSSRSVAARLVRCALAESVIAKAITEHIFAEFFFPEQPNVQGAIRAVLNLFDPTATKRQRIVRCQLLAEHADDQNDDETYNNATENAVEQCRTILSPMLVGSAALSEFTEKLRGLCKEGLELWSPLKWGTKRIAAVFSVGTEAFMQDDYDDEVKLDEAEEQERRKKKATPVCQLFPRILQDNEVLFDGYVLGSNQRAVFAAANEEQRRLSTGSLNGHLKLTRSRAASVAQASGPSSDAGLPGHRGSHRRSLSKPFQGMAPQTPPISPTTDPRNGASVSAL